MFLWTWVFFMVLKLLGVFGRPKTEKEEMRERYLREAELAREYEYALRQQ